jgi:hypothetical protein
MTHPNEVDLLKHALELHDSPADQEQIESHLADCPVCASRIDRIREDMKIISGIRLQGQLLYQQRRRTSHASSYLRVAAIIVLSFAAGYLASQLANAEPATVVPSTLLPSAPETDQNGSAVSDATTVYEPAPQVQSE